MMFMASRKNKTTVASTRKGITVGDFIKFIQMNYIPNDALILANLPAGRDFPKDYSKLETPWKLVFVDEGGTEFDSFVALDYVRPY
jgi:hypothetical protein